MERDSRVWCIFYIWCSIFYTFSVQQCNVIKLTMTHCCHSIHYCRERKESSVHWYTVEMKVNASENCKYCVGLYVWNINNCFWSSITFGGIPEVSHRYQILRRALRYMDSTRAVQNLNLAQTAVKKFLTCYLVEFALKSSQWAMWAVLCAAWANSVIY